jgi:peptide/nickel transport system permease protein
MTDRGRRGASAIERTRPWWYRWLLIWRSYRRNRTAVVGLGIVVSFTVMTILAPLYVPHDPDFPNTADQLASPSTEYFFGTDSIGRDIFSRVVYGARVSLQVGIFAVLIAATVGILAGVAAGYYGRWIDSIIMRIVDAILAFPGLLFAIFLVGVLGPSIRNAMLAISVTFVPGFARLTRANTLAIREMEFVTSAQAIGATDWRIMLIAVVPNLMSTAIVQLSLAMSGAILVEAGLSFLGLGVQPPTPAWGSMLGEGREYIRRAWWMTTFPGLAIFFTVLSFNFIGDGLREALDPRQRRA